MPKPYIETLSRSVDFYRDNYRLMLKLCIFTLMLILIGIAWMFYDFFNEPETEYFITTTNGQVKKLVPRK